LSAIIADNYADFADLLEAGIETLNQCFKFGEI